MKRFRRGVFSGFAALSLLLCVVTVVLWERSYSFFPPSQFGDHLVLLRGQNTLELDSFQGRISLHAPVKSLPPVVANGVWTFTYVAHREYFGMPHIVAVSLLILLPGLWIYRFLFRRQTKSGVCRQCGYDLRATPDRCPECGTVPANP
jgi:hypothetical protein